MSTLNSSGPSRYRIRVQGELSESWSDRLGGMEITVERFSFKGSITVLIGDLKDQGALTDVLNTLYEMHAPVLSVEKLEMD